MTWDVANVFALQLKRRPANQFKPENTVRGRRFLLEALVSQLLCRLRLHRVATDNAVLRVLVLQKVQDGSNIQGHAHWQEV